MKEKNKTSRDPVGLLCQALREKWLDEIERCKSMRSSELEAHRKAKREHRKIKPASKQSSEPLILAGVPIRIKRPLLSQLREIAALEGVTVNKLAYRLIGEQLAKGGAK